MKKNPSLVQKYNFIQIDKRLWLIYLLIVFAFMKYIMVQIIRVFKGIFKQFSKGFSRVPSTPPPVWNYHSPPPPPPAHRLCYKKKWLKSYEKLWKMGVPQWYQRKNSNNTTIKEAIRFLQVAKKNEQRNFVKLWFPKGFHGVFKDFQGFHQISRDLRIIQGDT